MNKFVKREAETSLDRGCQLGGIERALMELVRRPGAQKPASPAYVMAEVTAAS